MVKSEELLGERDTIERRRIVREITAGLARCVATMDPMDDHAQNQAQDTSQNRAQDTQVIDDRVEH